MAKSNPDNRKEYNRIYQQTSKYKASRKKYRQENAEKVAAQKAASYRRNLEKNKARSHEYHMENKEARNASSRQYKLEHKEELQIKYAQWRAKRIVEVLRKYSPNLECAYCGDNWIPALCLDHMDGDGRAHRKITTDLYRWIKAHNYPPGFQVLCASCNWVKGTLTDKQFKEIYPERINVDSAS